MTDSAKRLGYGGSGEVDGEQVLITSGSFNTSPSPSFLEMLDIPPNNDSRSRVLHADGVEAYGGNISFDLTMAAMSVLSLSKLLMRGYVFDVGIDDGEDAFLMEDCSLTSLSLGGSAGGLLTASLNFVSVNEAQSSILVDNDFIRDTDPPLGYWYSGNTDVRDWSFGMNQAVTPMYVNRDEVVPRYLKVGLIDFSLSVTTYEAIQAHTVINIATSAFTLTGVTTSEGYSFGGMTELGTYSHQFDTAASIVVGSGDTIIT